LLSDVDAPFVLRATERTALLCALLPTVPLGAMNRWRIAHERQRPPPTPLWPMVARCVHHFEARLSSIEELEALLDRMHAAALVASPRGGGVPSAGAAAAHGGASASASARRRAKRTQLSRSVPQLMAPVDPDSRPLETRAALLYLLRRLTALAAEPRAVAARAWIAEHDLNVAESASAAAGVSWVEECCVCYGDFAIADLVGCSPDRAGAVSSSGSAASGSGGGGGGGECHWICVPCFREYVATTLAPTGVGIAGCMCPVQACTQSGGGAANGERRNRTLFAAARVRSSISALDAMNLAEAEEARSRTVALAGAARLFCRCGIVGVVQKEDMGDGKVQCPRCGVKYCARCGNDDHGKAPCPPSSSMVQWLGKNAKNTKRCPNCATAVSKNGGCNHMTCAATAGGCGHEFCWLCLGNYPRCECGAATTATNELVARLARRAVARY
jgi:hypothetical protein